MGTRSFIAVKTESGYKGVYCHWDGYLSNNGRILFENYTDLETVNKLIDGGGISSLGEIIGDKHDFDDRESGTTYYHRDRDEEWEDNKPTEVTTLFELTNTASQCGTEYLYLFEDGKWKYADRGAQYFGGSDGSSFRKFKKLTQKAIEKK